jgi:hypothetical protein
MGDPRYRGEVTLRLTPLLGLLLAACTATPASTPPPSLPPTPTPDLSQSCSGAGLSGEAPSYPGWPPDAAFELVPIPVSSELAVGSNRFLLSLIDAQNEQLASADRPVELRFYDLAVDAQTPAITVAATYMPTTAELPGLYRVDEVRFPCWGEWGLEAITTEPDGSQRTGRMIFPVRPASSTPPIGAPAPVTATPTADTPAEIAAISTDTEPDADFYTTSVDTALAEHKPFLVIFSTPAFCRTRTCGPALDIVKDVAAQFKPEVTFIHVEPYLLEQVSGNLQPVLSDQNQPIPVAAVTDWGLPTEPYIFVVDADGRVTAKLEGVAAADELEAALREVAD